MFDSLSSFVNDLPVIGNIFEFITTVFDASKDLVKDVFSGSSEGSSFDGSLLTALPMATLATLANKTS